MEPALHNRQVALMDRDWYRHHAIARGDVVICYLDGEWIVKRVEGLPGQRMRWDSGVTVRDGHVVDTVLQETVPDHHVFLLGDNRGISLDSRLFGPVPVASIVGRLRPL